MSKITVLTAAIAAALGAPMHANAEDQNLAQLRAEIAQMKQSYEARIQALEQRLQASETRVAAATPAEPARPAPPGVAASRFNPAVSLILSGTYARLSQDPERYRLQGFIPGGDEIGPGKRNFSLGESELSLSASIDPHFSGKLTLALSPENEVGVEEAFFETQSLGRGLNLRGGRFLSGIGYLNGQHAHTWNFVDAPLVYQAFFGGQYRQDGLQLRWLAPTERFVELGVEAGNGSAFPGSDRNRNGIGSTAVFARVGDDIGTGGSWRAGISYLHTRAAGRSYEDTDSAGADVTNAFAGKSRVWSIDGIYKWAPDGNATRTNFKLQGEYFRRRERGVLTYDTLAQSLGTASLPYASAQSGWYLQGVYQFLPGWRVGLRHDRLRSGAPGVDLAGSALTTGDFGRLAAYNPRRTALMLDYAPSEFSRVRLQLAEDRSRPEAVDRQVFLQYVMSLGAHGAHAF